MLWLKAKELKQRPSDLLDIQLSNYVAYCLDEAVVFFGMQLEAMLDEAGQKPDKESARIERERKRVLDKVFSDESTESQHFSDPAVMFGN
jgi:hypothetical protein